MVTELWHSPLLPSLPALPSISCALSGPGVPSTTTLSPEVLWLLLPHQLPIPRRQRCLQGSLQP